MAQIHRTALILHQMPKEIMTLSRNEINNIWSEHIDMTMEQTMGKKRPKLYEYERQALNKLKEQFNE